MLGKFVRKKGNWGHKYCTIYHMVHFNVSVDSFNVRMHSCQLSNLGNRGILQSLINKSLAKKKVYDCK